MHLISDIFKGNSFNFLSLNNVKKKFLNTYGETKVAIYCKSLTNIPLNWEDSFTSIHSIDDEILEIINNEPMSIYGEIIKSEFALSEQCMLVSLTEKELNPDYKLMLGWATINEACEGGYEWHLHFFCLTPDGKIIEPTPLIRSRYFGTLVDDVNIELLKLKLYPPRENK